MNDFELQWKNLSNLGHSGGRLRVYPDHILDFFIDYSLNGSPELIIEAVGVDHFGIELPFFENLDVVFREIEKGTQLGLILTDEHLFKNFTVMSYDIAERSKNFSTINEAFSSVIDCLRNWADLLKRRGKVGLSRNEAIGLWGELITLNDLLASSISSHESIVFGWRGPNGDQRDIGFNKRRIEIKTQLSTKAVSLRVTSLDQLDDKDGSLNVVLNRISPSDFGLSILDLIANISNSLTSNRISLSEFERKILLAGVDDGFEVFSEKFELDERLVYVVDDSFPRLTPKNVPVGIKSAEYEISGIAISKFQLDWQDFLESIND
jgi:hypothetical protein